MCFSGSRQFILQQGDPVGQHYQGEDEELYVACPVDHTLTCPLQCCHVDRQVEEDYDDFGAADHCLGLDLVGTLHTRIDDERDKRHDVSEQVQMYFMCVVGGLYQVDYTLCIGHCETQEEESHDLAVEVQSLGPIESHVAYRTQRFDSIVHLVLHHLHELAESCIFIRVNHVVL